MRNIAALLLLVLTFSAHAKRVALIIGNSNYDLPLKNAANDAKLIAQSLEAINFEIVKFETDLDLGGFRRAVADFGDSLEEGDIAFFFYAGHGIQSSRINYLMPVDHNVQVEDDLQYETYNVGSLFKMLASKRTKANIVILDACRDNPLSRSLSRSEGGTGLASMEPPIDTVVAFSTKAGETASDGLGPNSPYTTELVKFLTAPNATISSIFQQVRTNVLTATAGKQVPTEYTLLREDVVLNKTAGGGGTSTGPGPVPTPQGPTSFQDLKNKLISLVRGVPISLRDRTVITDKINIKDDCSFEIEKTYDFHSQSYQCRTSGNLKNVNLNYTFQPSSGESFTTFQGVSTTCKRNGWSFYSAQTWVFHVPPKESKEAHSFIQKLKSQCR